MPFLQRIFGPVLFYDMVRLARRLRYFLLRMVYAGVLIFFLFITWEESAHWGSSILRDARIAQMFFFQFMIIQLMAVMLLTPAYVGGSIAEEKQRKTLEFMLATDLSSREIVLSKLVSRLGNMVMLVLVGLPILSVLQFLGGIDPNLLLMGFAATFVTMYGLGGYSMLCSVYFKKPRDAIVCSYLGPIAYLLAGLFAAILQHSSYWRLASIYPWEGGPSISDIIDFGNSGNTFTSFIHIAEAMDSRRMGDAGSTMLWVLRNYAIFHLVFGSICITWSVLRLRPVALKQMSEAPRKGKQRERRRPAMSDRPVLWREVYIEGRTRSNWMLRLVIAFLVLLTVGISVFWMIWTLMWYTRDNNWRSREMAEISTTLGIMIGCLVLLGVSIRASTSISSERDKETFDFLLTTPLDSDTILWHKFLGCLFSLRKGFYWLAAIWLAALVADGMYVVDVFLVSSAILVYACAFIMIGLWYSMTCRSGISASVWTISTVVILAVGHWIPTACCFTFFRNGHDLRFLRDCQLGVTPPFVLFHMQHGGWMLRHHDWAHSEVFEHYFVCVVGLALYVVAMFLFWYTALSPRFRKLTHRENRTRPGRRR